MDDAAPPPAEAPAAALARLVDAYRQLGVRIEPPLSGPARNALMTELLRRELPPDLDALIGLTGGMRGWATDFTFRVSTEGVDPPYASVNYVAGLGMGCLEIGGDGFGNRHLVQPRRERSPVWFWAHDPDMLVLSARSLVEYLERRLPYVRAMTELEEVHHGEGEQPPSPDHDVRFLEPIRAGALSEAPSGVTSFLAECANEALCFDFRQAVPGDAIDLARYSQIDLSGFGDVFVWTPPAPKPKKRWWHFW